jgi:glucose/arabinose dehydrogenase
MRIALTVAIAAFAAACASAAPKTTPWGNPSISPGHAPVVDPTAVPKAANVTVSTVTAGLEHPWGMAFLPNGDLLVTERPGRLRLVREGKLEAPISGVPSVLALRQGGLLDVSLDPQFVQNRTIYLCFSAGDANANGTRAVRATLNADATALSNVTEIFRAEPLKANGFHFGCRFAWGADGALFLSIGDGGGTRNQAQELGSHLGKLLRLNPAGGAPSDNPFNARMDAKPEVFSYGHRNIQGLAIGGDGRIFATEHGAQGGDELNLVRGGGNYGWPKVTYAVEYGPDQKPISYQQSARDVIEPLVVFTPSIAPSGLAVHSGKAAPAWKDQVFVGGLITGARANPGSIFRVRINGAKGEVLDRVELDGRVRDVREGPDGALYALTDEANGKVIRIAPTS